MSRADIVTKLPLANWAKLMGLHPLHFSQVRLVTNPHCSQIYFQYPWQTADHVSREEIAQAIKEAEDNIEKALGYRLAPCWEVDEWRETTRPFNREFVNYSAGDVRGYRSGVQANWGYFISGGIQAKTLIEAGVSISYSDLDNDNYDETATVVVTTSALDKNEIAVFYPDKNGSDGWEIRPTEVVISGGNATITFRRELAVVPEKIEALDIEGAEAIGIEDDDFLEEVDIYRRYNDPQSQASFLWEPFAGGWCGTCNGSGCFACSYAAQTGCLIVRGDPRQSLIGYGPGSWDSDDNDFVREAWAVSRQPDIVRLYYYSGWRDKSSDYVSRMDQSWQRTVAYYAASLLDRPPCDCSADVWRMWREDLTITAGDEDGMAFYRTPSGILDNPFGTRRGQVNAWRRVRSQIIGKAVALV